MATDTIELLAGLSAEEVDQFLALADLREYRDDEVIISEGAAGDCLFIVASGGVRVLKSTLARTEEELTILEAGECFGELSLVDRQPRSATVRAAGSASVHAVMRPDLARLFDSRPHIQTRVLENLVRITARRLRNLDDVLVRSLYDSVVLVDSDFRVVSWDRVTGKADLMPEERSAESAAGETLFAVAEQIGEGVCRQIRDLAATGKVARMQLDYQPASGEQVYLELTLAPHLEGTAPAGLVVGIRNISETKRLEVQLLQAEKLAMAGQMAAEIGHELNNYLAVVSGHNELLLMQGDIGERAQRHAQAISDQLSKILRFTSGLMDFAVLRPRTEPTDINDLIGKLIQFIQGQSRFRRVTFEQQLSKELPRLKLDPGQIQQVLLNLYANAADAMGEGRVTTTTSYDAQIGQITVCVSDNGPGMPPEVRERIFESGYTTKSTGHGFGLAVCKRIVENSHATIDLKSEEGVGTVFTLVFDTAGSD